MVKNKSIIIIIVVAFIGITGVLYSINIGEQKEAVVVLTNDKEPVETEVGTQQPVEDVLGVVYVHICGEVVSPGVYELLENSRVIDLIVAAGGLTKHAAGNYVNQAEQLKDGQRIYIPSLDEADDFENQWEFDSEEGDNKSSLVNINTANIEQLMTIPGIGQSKATSIIQYREENGSFQSIDEIKNIEGIKEGVFQKIKDFIKI